MTVDIFEGVIVGIGHRHKLDHTSGRMRRCAGRFIKVMPSAVVRFDGLLHHLQNLGNAHLRDKACRIAGAEKIREHGCWQLGLRSGHDDSS